MAPSFPQDQHGDRKKESPPGPQRSAGTSTPTPEYEATFRKTATRLLASIRKIGQELSLDPAVLDNMTLSSRLGRDLGLDSLAQVELLSRVERQFNVTLGESAFQKVRTVEDLLRAVLSPAEAEAMTKSRDALAASLRETDLGSPENATTLPEVLLWHMEQHSYRPHLRLLHETGPGEPQLTYGDLYRQAASVGAGLQKQGISPGDRIALMLPTGLDYFACFFGAILCGAIPVALYPPTKMSQLEDHIKRHGAILSNCGAVVLVVDKQTGRAGRLLKGQAPELTTVVTVDDLQGEQNELLLPSIRSDNVAFMQYTSGSTGQPKGVILTHQNILANIRAMGRVLDASSRDVFVSWLPLYHDMGLIGIWLGSLYYGAYFAVMSPLAFLARPERWLWAIHSFGGTLTAAPNFAYELCLKRIPDEAVDGLDLSSLRAMFNGAESVSPHTLERFAERFARLGLARSALMPVYGLAESSVGLIFPPLGRGPKVDRLDREAFTREGRARQADESDKNPLLFPSCGTALSGHEVRIVDEQGRDMPECRQGSMQFRGPSATQGYWENPRETKKLIDGDWLNTGDLAYKREGEYYITGRTKDVIIRGGRNVFPHELEEAVGELEDIRKGCVAAFAATDEASATERLVVLAETREKDEEKKSALRGQINETVEALVGLPPDTVILARPHTVLKTSSGKIRRAACRALYESGHLGGSPRSVMQQALRLKLESLGLGWRRKVTFAKEYLYSAYVWGLLGVMAPFALTGILLLPSLSARWRFLHYGIRLLFRLSGIQVTVNGQSHRPRGGAVIVANHSSYLDGIALVAALPEPVRFVGKAELKSWPIVSGALQRMGVQFVERLDKEKGLADARQIAENASEDQPLLFFPEGTFTRTTGLLPFHMGAFHAAASALLPVVPVVLKGTRHVLQPDTFFIRRGPVTALFGAPLPPEIHPDSDAGARWHEAVRLREKARSFILENQNEPDLARESFRF